MDGNRPSQVPVIVIGCFEATGGILTLLFSLYLIVGSIIHPYGEGIPLGFGVFLLPIAIVAIVAGSLLVKQKSLGRDMSFVALVLQLIPVGVMGQSLATGYYRNTLGVVSSGVVLIILIMVGVGLSSSIVYLIMHSE